MDKTTDKKDHVTIPKKDYDELRKAYKKMDRAFGLLEKTKKTEESSKRKTLKDLYGVWENEPEIEKAIKDLRKEWKKWDEKSAQKAKNQLLDKLEEGYNLGDLNYNNRSELH